MEKRTRLSAGGPRIQDRHKVSEPGTLACVACLVGEGTNELTAPRAKMTDDGKLKQSYGVLMRIGHNSHLCKADFLPRGDRGRFVC
jgi:hypothetical protein